MNAMRYENSVPLGYEGDTDSDSSNNDDSGDDQSVDEIEEEYPVEQRNREASSPLTMRVAGRKRLHDKSTSRPRSSASLRPMHPDIDWTTTTHLATKRQKLTPSLTPASTKPPVSMYAMSQLLNDYFHQQKFEVKSTFGSEGTPSEMTECSGAPAPPQVLHVRSYMPIQIEEALRFSSCARMLIGAEHPHNVVHTNASFARMQEGTTSPATSGRSLKDVVSLMFAGRPVTMYPVQASDEPGKVRFYLAEYNADTGTPLKRAFALDTPARMIG